MKRSLISVCLIGSFFLVLAQQQEYKTLPDIPYYIETINPPDTYLKERCVLDIYYPVDGKGFATVIWFHGGGLTGGNKEIPESLKKQGICIIAANYRLSPKVPAYKSIEDAAAAMAWAFKNLNRFGGDTTLIFVSGHSAGAYLANMIGLDKKWLKTYHIDANRIAGILSLSGQAITHFTIRKEKGLPETQPTIDEFAPLFHVRADAPPLMLITGDRELELLGRYEENAYLYRMMKVAGHKQTRLLELDGYGHDMTEPAFPLLLNEVRRIRNERKNAN